MTRPTLLLSGAIPVSPSSPSPEPVLPHPLLDPSLLKHLHLPGLVEHICIFSTWETGRTIALVPEAGLGYRVRPYCPQINPNPQLTKQKHG